VQATLRAGQESDPRQAGARAANIISVLQRLYAQLIAPLEGLLAGVQRLIIVPHGPLHYLPFHALFDGQYHLLERFEVSYLPGSSLLRYARGMRSPGSETRVLALGNSFHGRLPYAVEEARTVAELWGCTALVEEEASLDSLHKRASECHVLHLATHGEFRGDNALFSGLALSDGWLTTLDIFNLRLNAELVTLSACQTGRSVVGGGDELFGLMRAFLSAGAASLVATLWTVEDRSTALLMQRFYQRLVKGESRGGALREAQLQFLREDENKMYNHPYFWASFFLVGDTGAARGSVQRS
jgi:CHAT domain-containing protein